MMNSLLKKINTASILSILSLSLGAIHQHFILILTVSFLSLYIPETCHPQEKGVISHVQASIGMEMTKGVMCEEIKDGQPLNEGLIFSSGLGKITCYTEFDSITEKTTIYHCWYFKDNLSTKRKLILNPPHWSVFSQIQLRETEKGPWRVEILDQDGNVLQILRFSIID